MTAVREQLSAKQIARVRISEITLEMKKLANLYGILSDRDYDSRYDELLTLKRLNESILYENKELADNKVLQWKKYSKIYH